MITMRILKKHLLDELSQAEGFVTYGVIPFIEYQLATSFTRTGYEFAKTIISFALPYESNNPVLKKGEYRFAKFAYGVDYHRVVFEKIFNIKEQLEREFGVFQYSINVDTNWLDEKTIASMAGIGFIGRNTLVISKQKGSFFVLGELCLDLESEFYTSSIQNGCHHCKRCVDACPTSAIQMNASDFVKERCLSHLTQRKNPFDDIAFDSVVETIFGCDICQEVCPYNQKQQAFDPLLSIDPLSITTLDQFLKMTKDVYDTVYLDKTFHWVRYEVILRNIIIASVNQGTITKEKLEEIRRTYHYLPWMIPIINQAIERMNERG